MSQSSDVRVHQLGVPSDELRSRCMAVALLTSALTYVALALTFDPVGPAIDNAADVFISASLPTLIVVLVLWFARPTLFDRALRREMILLSLGAAACVALAPCILAGA